MSDQLYEMPDGSILPGHTDDTGIVRVLGCLPSGEGKLAFASWGDSKNPTIPRSQWKPFDRSRPEIPILDQGSHGSCVGHGSGTANMYSRALSGMTFQYLSSCFLYGLINGNRDNGANISDAMTVLLETGMCLESEVPEGTIYQRQFPSTAKTTAARFKASQAYNLADWDEVCTAAQLGFAISLSVYVAGNWNVLDVNGCPPAYRGTGNHCVFMGESMKQASNGEWILGGRNSWGTQWGNQGRFAIREAHLASQYGFDAFAIKSSVTDPLGPDHLPVNA